MNKDDLDLLLQSQDTLMSKMKDLDSKLHHIEYEASTLETRETSILQQIIENILPVLGFIYRSAIKFPVGETDHTYPEIVLCFDRQKKAFYTLTKNGEIMERDFINPTDLRVIPTWQFVGMYPLEVVVGNIAKGLRSYENHVAEAESRHQSRQKFLETVPMLKMPGF